MLTKPEHVKRAIEHAGDMLVEAYDKYQAGASAEVREEAIEYLVEACRKLLAIVKYQQEQIEQFGAMGSNLPLCAHGARRIDCSRCDYDEDLAFDAAREKGRR